ncbi:sterol-4-alpha-carboxylate 3-dehydrogenase, decarboxylating [Podospora conica]|nr:sterol-4-alpha-carboxylate 3-dehydrogenase, decarboxylating [Schizothecium conicum]
MATSSIATAAFGLCVGVLLWLYRVNQAMKVVPKETAQAAPRRWTTEEIQETYERMKKKPSDFAKHLPPSLDRRYVVFGGAGMVGGDIVLQLLQRGQSPESIRIIDFQPVSRQDVKEKAKGSTFVKADMTSPASVEAAFSTPWPASVAKKPLTVFHTAAMIDPAARSERLYGRIRRVNVDGTANVLGAAKAAGADIFVATSSASASFIPADLWIWPWQSMPGKWYHSATEADFDSPLRPHDQFFSNYAKSKAEAERLICGSNQEGFRTGTIRPGNGIYGQKTDPVLGALLTMGGTGTWLIPMIQNFVDSRNVSLAHLQLEAALARKPMPPCAGRPLVVTDPGPPLAFGDMYKLATQLSLPPITVVPVPPVTLLLLAHAIEIYVSFITRFPGVASALGLKEPKYPLSFLQPAVLRGATHILIDDSVARRRVEDGGIGYTGVCTSLEGFCEELVLWNREYEEGLVGGKGGKGVVEAAGVAARGVGG